jgi:hypothetical protein
MSDQPQQLSIPAVNVTVDVKEAILKILEKSDLYFDTAAKDEGDTWHGCMRMNANNQCIRALLEAIK